MGNSQSPSLSPPPTPSPLSPISSSSSSPSSSSSSSSSPNSSFVPFPSPIPPLSRDSCRACSSTSPSLAYCPSPSPTPAPSPSPSLISPNSSSAISPPSLSSSSPSSSSPCYSYSHSLCPLNREEIGRCSWAFLHTLSSTYPVQASPTQQSEMKTFLELFIKTYPCGYCSDQSAVWVRANPVEAKGQKELSLWMCQLHNEVNERIYKPKFDCSKTDLRWRVGIKECYQ